MPTRVKRTINKEVTKNFSVTLTADEIRKRFRLPADAEVVIRDSSGQDQLIEERLSARWSRQS